MLEARACARPAHSHCRHALLSRRFPSAVVYNALAAIIDSWCSISWAKYDRLWVILPYDEQEAGGGPPLNDDWRV